MLTVQVHFCEGARLRSLSGEETQEDETLSSVAAPPKPLRAPSPAVPSSSSQEGGLFRIKKGYTPVQLWAIVGALFALFWAYVLIMWVTGPFFTPVESGPDEPPTYMKIALFTWQAAAIPLVGYFIYRFLIRPWRRERVVATDGLIVLAALMMALQDPVSSYFGHWYTYNTWMFNMGGFTNEIPGWQAFGEPGAQQGYPILFHLLAYPLAVGIGCVIGQWVMNKARSRRAFGPIALIAICFASLLVFDFVLEALFWAPLGFYSLAGGHFSLFPETYHKFPLHEAIFGAAFFTAPAVLRYFKNDKGETIVERGVTDLKMSTGKKTLLRLLALCAALQISYLFTYNLPIAGWIAADPGVWPKDVQSRTYLNDRLCGAGTDRLCPGNGIPLTMSTQVDKQGNLVGPDAEALTPVNEIDMNPPGPFSGKIAGGSE